MTKTVVAATAITEETVASRNPNLISTAVRDETVMMDLDSGKYYGLDDIGSVIWQRLEKPQTFGTLIDFLTAEYAVERSVIAEDVARLLALMAEHEVVRLA